MASKNARDTKDAQYLEASKLTEKQVAVERNERGVGREELIRDRISKRLQEVWQSIYMGAKGPLDQGPKGPIKKGEEMVKELVEKKWGVEVAIDLTVLTLFNVAILIGMFWC